MPASGPLLRPSWILYRRVCAGIESSAASLERFFRKALWDAGICAVISLKAEPLICEGALDVLLGR